MNIGEKIAGLRKSHNYSQETLAKMIHVSRQTVSNWENGKSYPDLETILQISDIFEISIDEWLREDTTIVKRIDAEKKKKSRLFIVSAILLALTITFAGSAFWYSQSERTSFSMQQDKVIAGGQAEIEVGTGFFTLPRKAKMKLSVDADTDDGKLLVEIIESSSGRTVYQKDGADIRDKQIIYLEKGDYRIQVTAADFDESRVALSYNITVSNK